MVHRILNWCSTSCSADLHLISWVPLLHPEEQVFTAMLGGWRNQQQARNLAHGTVEAQSLSSNSSVAP